MRKYKYLFYSAMVLLIVTWLMIIFAVVADAQYVTAPSGLNVRSKKSVDSDIIETLPFGSEVEILKSGRKWSKIQNGYVRTEWLSDQDPLDGMTYMGTWRITAYAYTGSPCANGSYPEAGYTIAHNSLPFGTQVYISGVGFRTVEDRGPSWLGSEWCDLYMGDTGSCIAWGDQYREVWIVG